MTTFVIHHLHINTNISCLLTQKADPKVEIAAPLVLKVLRVFTKRVCKQKPCTNVRLHDENHTSFVVLLLVHKMGWGRGGGRLFEEGRLFEIPADRRGASSKGPLIGRFAI